MDDLLGRQAPHSLEAEQAVLGSILIDSRCINDVIGAVRAEDFYLQTNRDIFETVYEMFSYSQTIDPVTVLDKMRERGVYDEQTSTKYVMQLMEITPTAANAKQYAQIVHDKGLQRNLAEAASDVVNMVYEGVGSAQDMLEAAEKKIYALRRGNTNESLEHVGTILLKVFDRLTELSESGSDISGIPSGLRDLDKFISSSEALIETVTAFVKENLSVILSTSVGVGKGALQFLIAFLLSIYLLGDKARLKAGGQRLLTAALGQPKYEKLAKVLRRCHSILNRYIVFNLLDSLIVGGANAIFMGIVGMPYVGLVSFLVAVTNLVPTFGPVIGGIIGGFVLLMVNPWHALAFLIFTAIIQTVDGYILKPKLFGDSLGVSGLWILVGVIVGGRAFGVAGILLAIPGVAILDFLHREHLLPWLESRHKE